MSLHHHDGIYNVSLSMYQGLALALQNTHAAPFIGQNYPKHPLEQKQKQEQMQMYARYQQHNATAPESCSGDCGKGATIYELCSALKEGCVWTWYNVCERNRRASSGALRYCVGPFQSHHCKRLQCSSAMQARLNFTACSKAICQGQHFLTCNSKQE